MPGQLSLRCGTSKANLGTKEARQQAAVLCEKGSQFPLTITSITVLWALRIDTWLYSETSIHYVNISCNFRNSCGTTLHCSCSRQNPLECKCFASAKRLGQFSSESAQAWWQPISVIRQFTRELLPLPCAQDNITGFSGELFVKRGDSFVKIKRWRFVAWIAPMSFSPSSHKLLTLEHRGRLVWSFICQTELICNLKQHIQFQTSI